MIHTYYYQVLELIKPITNQIKTEGGLKMDYEITKHGADNEGLQNNFGYCQAVSGLHPLTDEYDAMLTAEGKFWLKLKLSNPVMYG